MACERNSPQFLLNNFEIDYCQFIRRLALIVHGCFWYPRSLNLTMSLQEKVFLRAAGFKLAALVLLVFGTLGNAASVTLDFEGETAGSSTVPSGWGYLDSGLGGSGTYTVSAAGGGSTGTGLGGVLTSPNPTHGTKLPYSFLVNSGSAQGFDVRNAISGSYDFKFTDSSAYDSSGFLFGDISGGTIGGSDAGQLLLTYHSNGGYGNAPSRIVDGSNTSLADGGSNFSDNTWYRTSFTWTPTSGTTGDFTRTSTRWNGSAWVSHSTLSVSGFTFDDPEAYVGVADLWASDTTFDNISVTGDLYVVPEPSVLGFSMVCVGLAALLRRRRT